MDGTLAIVSNADSPWAQLCISRSTLLTVAGAEFASGDKVSVTTDNASDAGDSIGGGDTGGGMDTVIWHCGAANVGIDCCCVYTISGGGGFLSLLSFLLPHHEQINSKPTVPAKAITTAKIWADNESGAFKILLVAGRNQIKLILRFELLLISSSNKILNRNESETQNY
ncbi:hypothetical protein T01_703 [Trichinella spiralis]|uniref:Uncharacterized protein n=1 Tax=Trichinella spiralis TaxID=6334 RepID=A0A0V1B8Z0_TRISP|nr:hypothetical protein T01_703 [Trichinella spiralis]